MHASVTEGAVTTDVYNESQPKRRQIHRHAAAASPGALWTARGYKPAYLWDASEPAERAVVECLRQCRATCDGVVRALRLGSDVVLCNVAETRRRLADWRLGVKFVDVSAHLRCPVVLTSAPAGVGDMLASLELMLERMATSPPESLNETASERVSCAMWNLCTAFGVLLGYPVVYWFDGGADAANCLALEELNVVRVRCAGQGDLPVPRTSAEQGDEVYSFSFPLRLRAELGPHVDAWWQELSLKARDFTRVDQVKCCPVVAL